MLRLAHRILTQPLRRISDNRKVQEDEGIASRLRQIVRTAPILVADNVFAFYFAGVANGTWETAKDFPCVVPPWPECFIEWAVDCTKEGELERRMLGTVQLGAAVICRDLRQPGIARDSMKSLCAQHPDVGWAIQLTSTISVRGNAPWTVGQVWMATNKAGTVLGYSESIRFKDGKQLNLSINPALLALSFLNCKNVACADATAEIGPAAKWLRRKKAPEIRYHVLDINPMKAVLRNEGGSESNGLKKALHICRGHFATYTEDKPLFGRVVGTVWKPMHVRGSEDEGVVLKDYRVKV